MGLFSSIGRSLGLGGSSNVGRRAAEQQRIARGKGNVELQQQFDITSGEIGGAQDQLREDFLTQGAQTEEGFQPFIDIGTAATEELARGSTAEGFNEILQELIGGGQFQALQDVERREAQGQLSASGLGGTGFGVERLSGIGPQLALQLAGNLRGRQEFLSGQGFQGVGQRGQLGNQLFAQQGQLSGNLTSLLARLREQLSGRRASNIVGSGQAASSGILADEGINTQRLNNLFNLLSTGSKFIPSGG